MNRTAPDLALAPLAEDASAGAAMALRRRNVCVCADDFGLHEGINAAGYDLAERRRLGAASAMVDGACWRNGATALRDVPPLWLDVGLHLDLTEALPPGQPRKMPWRRLVAASFRQRLDPHWLAADIARQLDVFEAGMLRPPAFVSGHRHVHQLPQVREILLQVLEQRYDATRRPWLRHTRPVMRGSKLLGAGLINTLRAHAVACLGAKPLAQSAIERGFALNRAYAGVYGFDASARAYQQLFAAWLLHCRHGDVLACHPSNSVVPGDAIAHARCIEYQVMAADNFDQLLSQADVHIGPFSRCLHPDDVAVG